jgi:hypothetical protein
VHTPRPAKYLSLSSTMRYSPRSTYQLAESSMLPVLLVLASATTVQPMPDERSRRARTPMAECPYVPSTTCTEIIENTCLLCLPVAIADNGVLLAARVHSLPFSTSARLPARLALVSPGAFSARSRRALGAAMPVSSPYRLSAVSDLDGAVRSVLPRCLRPVGVRQA